MYTWRPRKALLFWTRGTSNPLPGCAHGMTRGTSNPLSGRPWDWYAIHTSLGRMSCPDSMVSVSNKSLDCVSRAIITHFTKSMFDRTFLSHFRRLAMTYPTPLAEQKDKDDSKSSLQQSLTAACRIMMALPPSKHHQNSQKVFLPFQGTKLLAL